MASSELDTGEATDPSRPGLASNASWRFVATVIRAVVGLLAVPLFTRKLGMTQWGLLALFQGAAAPLALLDLGFSAATVKYVAEALGQRDRVGAARVVHTTLVVNLVACLVGAGGLVLGAGWLARHAFSIPPEDLPVAIHGFRLTAAIWVVGVLSVTFLGVLSAHQRYDRTSTLGTVATVASTGLALVAAATTRDVLWVLAAQLAVAAVMALVYYRSATELLPELRGLPRWDRAAFRRSFSFGAWQAVGLAATLLSGWGDRYILGAWFLPAVVGFYAIANTLYLQLYSAFLEMGEVLFPAVSHLEGQGDLPRARRLALLVGWTLTSAYGIGSAVTAIVGGDFLALWISPETAREVTGTLRNLSVAGVIGMAAIAPFYYLLGIGRTRWDAVASIVNGASVVGVGLLLIPRLGLAAVGLGLVVGLLLRWGLLALIWRRHFAGDVTLGVFAAHVWAPALVAIVLALAGTRLHDAMGGARTWPGFLAECAVVTAVVAAIQVGLGEILPGGRQRRRDVVTSFLPVLQRLRGRAG